MKPRFPIRAVRFVAVVGRRGLRRRGIGPAGRGRTGRDAGRAASRRRMHGDMVAPGRQRDVRRPSQGALGSGGDARAEGLLPALRRRHRDAHGQLRRVHAARVPKFECTLRAHAGRVPAPDPGLPRRVVRRLQHHLHADAADERQVLHRGGLVGRRRLVQGRRQGRRRGAVPVQGPEGRRRVHVPGRPQRARDRGHHRAGAGAPARPRAHDQPARHHVPDHQRRHRRASSTTTAAVTGDRCDRDNAELVQDDEEGARATGPAARSRRRSAAWRTRRTPTRALPVARRTAARRATTSR